jgi:hypothetical protein
MDTSNSYQLQYDNHYPLSVESLDLPDLMKNPHVQSMYKSWSDASQQVVQSAQLHNSLLQENMRLNAEVLALKTSHRGLE